MKKLAIAMALAAATSPVLAQPDISDIEQKINSVAICFDLSRKARVAGEELHAYARTLREANGIDAFTMGLNYKVTEYNRVMTDEYYSLKDDTAQAAWLQQKWTVFNCSELVEEAKAQ